jgi:hypothetical protein
MNIAGLHRGAMYHAAEIVGETTLVGTAAVTHRHYYPQALKTDFLRSY